MGKQSDQIEEALLCFRCEHPIGVHDESSCRGGEDVLCNCDCFEAPEEDPVEGEATP